MEEHNIYAYISCKQSFKNRLKHGVWVDPTLPVEEIKRIIQAMLASQLVCREYRLVDHSI